MKKYFIVGGLIAGALLVSIAGGNSNSALPNKLDVSHSPSESLTTKQSVTIPDCDGVKIVADCMADGVKYASYIYHVAIPEKSHDETVTTYKQEVTGYCTLCNDGTYSPSCATGRGTCSHHDGVAQWNAPVSRNVPQYTTKKVIDTPAQEAYYQKVPQ